MQNLPEIVLESMFGFGTQNAERLVLSLDYRSRVGRTLAEVLAENRISRTRVARSVKPRQSRIRDTVWANETRNSNARMGVQRSRTSKFAGLASGKTLASSSRLVFLELREARAHVASTKAVRGAT